MNVAFISNIVPDFIVRQLRREFSLWTPDGFGQWMQECISPSDGLVAFLPEIVWLLFDGRAMMESGIAIDEAESAIASLAGSFSGTQILVSDIDVLPCHVRAMSEENFEGRFEREWSRMLSRLCARCGNVVAYGLKELVCASGRVAFYDCKMRYEGSMPYSLTGITIIKKEFKRFIAAYRGKRKKVLALDLDNTLWSGVIGEDGVSGIRLAPDKEGKPYTDFQKRIKEIKDRGALLVCISKNNEADVEPVWTDDRMALKKDDFAAFRINWDGKPRNLESIAQELNLGKDSFVFIDDNPAEREQMKAVLPEVIVPEFPQKPEMLENFIMEVAKEYFPVLKVTAEDRDKTAQYHAEAKRRELAGSTNSLGDYLRSLGIKAEIKLVSDNDVERVAQLSQKTNQFNVTANRYTVADMEAMRGDGSHRLFAVRACDRFGDSGLVAFVNVRLEGEAAEIVDFVMSCRVMNRTLEFAVESCIEEMLCSWGVSELRATYTRTAKNKPVEDLFEKFGFKTIGSENVVRHYAKKISKSCGGLPHYVTIVNERIK